MLQNLARTAMVIKIAAHAVSHCIAQDRDSVQVSVRILRPLPSGNESVVGWPFKGGAQW
jgi:hypothetical protein